MKLLSRNEISSLIFYFAAALLFSSIFWMKDAVDFLGWSITEVVAVLLLVRLLIRKERIFIPGRSLFLPWLLLVLWASLALTWSSNFHATLTGLYKILLIPFLLILFMNSLAEWQNAVTKIVPFFSFATALLIFLLPARPAFTSNLAGGFLALSGTLIYNNGLNSNGPKKTVHYLFGSLIVIALFLLNATGALIGLASGTIVLIYSKGLKKWHRWMIPLFLLLMIFVPFRKETPSIWQKKMDDPYGFERVQIWKDSMNYFLNHPWTGTGLGTYRDYYPQFKTIREFRNAPYAHNEIVQLACELGTIGILILCWLAFCVVRKSKTEGDRKVWIAILIAALVHALFDFNLHYPPVLLLCIFSLAAITPERKALLTPRLRWSGIFLLSLFGIAAALPGLADLIFRSSYANPGERKNGAILASKIDPTNAIYRIESGRFRDLLIAIELEPRNVWYRRRLAQTLFQDWEQSRRIDNLKEALRQYSIITSLAPNVYLLERERELIEEELQKNQKSSSS